MLSSHARYFINEIPEGTAERVYAHDFADYCIGVNKGLDLDRPNVGNYLIGARVAEYIRERIDPDKA